MQEQSQDAEIIYEWEQPDYKMSRKEYLEKLSELGEAYWAANTEYLDYCNQNIDLATEEELAAYDKVNNKMLTEWWRLHKFQVKFTNHFREKNVN